jgi:hypothetical protein
MEAGRHMLLMMLVLRNRFTCMNCYHFVFNAQFPYSWERTYTLTNASNMVDKDRREFFTAD